MTPTSLILGLLFFASESKAQIETMYNMYRFNPQILTPTQAGSTQHSEVIFLHRNQWVGIEGAPRTYSLTGNIKWGEKKGIGLVGMVDEVGPMRATVLSGDFAYHTRLNDKWRLSGGIRMSAANVVLNFSQLRLTNANDLLFQGDRSTGIQPNIGFGLRIHKGDGFYASFSMPRLGKYNFGQYNGAFKDVNYMYANVGTRIKLGGEITTKQGDVVSRVTLYPSVMARIAVDVPISWDVNLQANLKGKLDLGVSYRREDSYGFRAGIQATKKYYLTYVYEKPISDLAKVTSQTHEFGIRMFIFKEKKTKTESAIGEIATDAMPSRASGTEAVPSRTSGTETVPSRTTGTEAVPSRASGTEAAPSRTSGTEAVPSRTTGTEAAPSRTSGTEAVPSKASGTESAPSRTSVTEVVKPAEEDEYEYVTVTKTRVVRTRPKVAVPSKASGTATKSAIKSSTPVTQAKKSAIKSVAKKSTPSVKSANTVAADPNAPKVTTKRISNNVVETTVEKSGGSEAEVGIGGNQKVSKRKRKDGTEETVYTTTEVVKKKKVVK
jgi:type IX secretion system PorP/SprF family membrane protein